MRYAIGRYGRRSVRTVALPGGMDGSALKVPTAPLDSILSAITDERFSFSVSFESVG